MLQQPLVSIIVAIYNVEAYLCKCVESILNQTLREIEIILVDDGSADNCGRIIDEYSNKDPRVIAIHKENGGQSSARNMGLDIAKGKYIGFVDSDDWIDKNMYEDLYNEIEKSKSDIVVCGRQSYSESGELENIIEINNEEIHINNYSISSYITNKFFYKHTVVVWNKLYTKAIINDNNIRFEDVSYVGSEDALFNYKVLSQIKKIKGIDKIYYNQLSREGSTARTYKQGYMRRTGNLIKYMNEYSNNNNQEDIAKDIIPIFLLFFYQWNISQLKLFSQKDTFKLIESELEGVSNHIEFMKYVKELAFNWNTIRYMRNMGFRFRGIVLIKFIMMLCYMKSYKIATKVMLST